MDDPLRMYLVLLRGAVTELARAGELAGAAAVACVREFAGDPALAEWRARPGKVCLRARTESQWRQVLEQPHTLAGDAAAALAAAPAIRARAAARAPAGDEHRARAAARDRAAARRRRHLPAQPGDSTMSSGKTIAQIAHAAVMAAEHASTTGSPPGARVR